MWREYRALTGAAKRMMFYRLLLKEPTAAPARAAGAARARRAVQCGRLGALRALAREGGRRAGLHDLVRPAARIDRQVRRPAREADRRGAGGDRRARARRRVAQHGRAGHAGVLPQARRREAAARDRAGAAATAAASTRGSCSAPASRSCAPAIAWLDALDRGGVRACRRSRRSGRGTTRWSRRSSRRAVAAPSNIELVGVGHNAILADPGARAHVLAAIAAERARGATSGSPA